MEEAERTTVVSGLLAYPTLDLAGMSGLDVFPPGKAMTCGGGGLTLKRSKRVNIPISSRGSTARLICDAVRNNPSPEAAHGYLYRLRETTDPNNTNQALAQAEHGPIHLLSPVLCGGVLCTWQTSDGMY